MEAIRARTAWKQDTRTRRGIAVFVATSGSGRWRSSTANLVIQPLPAVGIRRRRFQRDSPQGTEAFAATTAGAFLMSEEQQRIVEPDPAAHMHALFDLAHRHSFGESESMLLDRTPEADSLVVRCRIPATLERLSTGPAMNGRIVPVAMEFPQCCVMGAHGRTTATHKHQPRQRPLHAGSQRGRSLPERIASPIGIAGPTIKRVLSLMRIAEPGAHVVKAFRIHPRTASDPPPRTRPGPRPGRPRGRCRRGRQHRVRPWATTCRR